MSFNILTAILLVSLKGRIDAGISATILQIITDLTVFFAYTARMYTDINSQMSSSQSIVEYTRLDGEDELVKPIDEELK